jgi:response regulator RpfG family c-di-GMP phosphodiesterase
MMSLQALIIDPNPTSRGYLWQATLAEVNFQRVKAYSKFDTALNYLQEGAKYDVLLITSQFPKDEIARFVEQAKLSEGGKEAAYVVVLKAAHQNTENIATSMMEGVDGFLFEPFSVQSLRQVAAIAARVKSEFEKQRRRAAISLYVIDVMKALDDYALALFSDTDVVAKNKLFLKSVLPFRKMGPEDLAVYYDVVGEIFEKARPRPPISYKGASLRVRQKAKEQTAKTLTEKPKKQR